MRQLNQNQLLTVFLILKQQKRQLRVLMKSRKAKQKLLKKNQTFKKVWWLKRNLLVPSLMFSKLIRTLLLQSRKNIRMLKMILPFIKPCITQLKQKKLVIPQVLKLPKMSSLQHHLLLQFSRTKIKSKLLKLKLWQIN